MLNNIDIVGKVITIGRLKFDYYNRLEAMIELEVFDRENNQNLECVCKGKVCEYILRYIKLNDTIFLNGNLTCRRIIITKIELL